MKRLLQHTVGLAFALGWCWLLMGANSPCGDFVNCCGERNWFGLVVVTGVFYLLMWGFLSKMVEIQTQPQPYDV